MPVIKSAKKKLRSDERKNITNTQVRQTVKNALKQFKTKPSNEALNEAYSKLDLAAKKHVIPKQRANRKKSRLAALLAKAKPVRSQPKSKAKKLLPVKPKTS